MNQIRHAVKATLGWIDENAYGLSLTLFCVAGVYWWASTIFGPGWKTGSWDIVKTFNRLLTGGSDGVFYFQRNDHRLWGLAAVFSAYALTVASARRRPPRDFWPSVGAVGLLSVLFLFSVGLYSRDIFEYLIRARVFAVYHENPYLVPPSHFPFDPYAPLIYWKDLVWVYGPVWLYATTLFALLPVAIPLTLAAFKAMVATMHIGSALILWSYLSDEEAGERGWRFAFYLLSPLAILEGAGNGHCDSPLLMFLLAGYWFARRRQVAAASAAMFAAALVKIYAGPILFFYACATFFKSAKATRARTAARLLIPPALMTVVFYLPFMTSAEALLAPFKGGSADRVAHSWAKAVSLALGPDSISPLIVSGLVLSLLSVAIAAWRSAATGEWKRPAAWFAFAWVAIGATWYMPWYSLLPFALSLTVKDRVLQAASGVLSVTAFFVHMDAARFWPEGWTGVGFALHMAPQIAAMMAAGLGLAWRFGQRPRAPRAGV